MISPDEGALYTGVVTHQRHRPFRHGLKYRVFMLLVDVDRIEALTQRLRVLGAGRLGLMSLRASDHGDGSDTPLRQQIETLMQGAGVHLDGGPVRLLTMPRVLGYGFNPLSVYYGHGPDGRLRAIVYEVSNTFGERHSYVVATPDADSARDHAAEKVFHVSPFMPLGHGYDFRLLQPGEHLSISINVRDGDALVLNAAFAATRRPLSDGSLVRAFLTHPLLTLKVIAAIHWEALRIVLKGGRYHRRPPLPARPFSHGRSRVRPAP